MKPAEKAAPTHVGGGRLAAGRLSGFFRATRDEQDQRGNDQSSRNDPHAQFSG